MPMHAPLTSTLTHVLTLPCIPMKSRLTTQTILSSQRASEGPCTAARSTHPQPPRHDAWNKAALCVARVYAWKAPPSRLPRLDPRPRAYIPPAWIRIYPALPLRHLSRFASSPCLPSRVRVPQDWVRPHSSTSRADRNKRVWPFALWLGFSAWTVIVTMAPLRGWLRAKAGGSTHISVCGDEHEPVDIPPFLLPLELRVKLSDSHSAPRRASSQTILTNKDLNASASLPRTRKRSRTMPSLLTRLTSAATYPIVVAQYKNDFRGAGHEASLHWVLIVITDKTTLSGPSFQAYAQTTRPRRPRRPRLSDSSVGTASSSASRRSTSASVTMGTRALVARDGLLGHTENAEAETDVQWYTRHGTTSLFDVCATVRTLCLGGVQVGSIKVADLEKLVEYLRSHPPVPSTPGWCSRDYVLELLELLRPFKLLRPDLQNMKAKLKGGKVEVGMADLLPELCEVGRETQESIDKEDFRPVVKYH
ncbi:hypothetical protein PYCCODRAFT_1281224 [Trametes coccinea BRFM310]|uniref:Uncharacterized protein n=1 Tax=Trametes coccinea (strain BRFM310) TaxID=1353009 RepID=A0A1Y2IXW9_TRAC3|nr:hypothetical protein PYCCODRAFT_1281224 [Trametes coccinea BRFM310]